MELKDSYFLLTELYDKFLALPLNKVLGVFKLESITPIPNNKNKYLLGITNVKGHIVPVTNLRFDEEISDSNLLVVFETSFGKEGAVFRDVKEVVFLSKEELEKVEYLDKPFSHGQLTKNSKEIILMDLEKKINFTAIENAFKPVKFKAA